MTDKTTFIDGVKQDLKLDPILPWTPLYVWLAVGIVALVFAAGIFVGTAVIGSARYQQGRMDEQRITAVRTCEAWLVLKRLDGEIADSEACPQLAAKLQRQ